MPVKRYKPSSKNIYKSSQVASVIYHDLFDYPLSADELIKWEAGERCGIETNVHVAETNGYYHLWGKQDSIKRRRHRLAASYRKLKIAEKAVKTFSLFPTIKMVGLTGSLAMKNARAGSDIDLMIITTNQTLWITRLFTWILLKLAGLKLRKPGEKKEKDRLCLNIWIDETDLLWKRKDRNIFTAHEIAQVVPLINKGATYERFIYQNNWVKEYWPKAVSLRDYKARSNSYKNIKPFLARPSVFIVRLLNMAAFRFQYWYMSSKMTRELVSPTRALFHPVDWSQKILGRLAAIRE